MRALGYRVIDAIVKHFTTLRERPVIERRTRAELFARIGSAMPAAGRPPDEVLEQVLDGVLTSIMHPDHPRLFAFIPGPSNFVGAMGDALASGFNVFAGHWLSGSGPAAIELATIDWLRQCCGLPAGAGGLFLSGGSMANLTALAAAREIRCGKHRPDAVVYWSDQTHSSLAKGLRVLGFAADQLRVLPTGAGLRLDPAQLEQRVRQDRAAGLHPMCVVANAGTTNSGAVDPLPEIARVCRAEDLWLHVDGAYGAAAVLCDEGRAALRGIDLADSITLDPHKWWFQPFEMGCLLVRDARHLRRTFGVGAAYLGETVAEEQEVNFYDYGIQLTRGFRALKLWMSVQVFGVDAFSEAVAGGLRLARAAEAMLREDTRWEVVTPAELGIVTFRFRRSGASDAENDALNREIVARVMTDGYAMVTSTTLWGRPVLRLCPIHPQATEAEVRETLRRMARFGGELAGAGAEGAAEGAAEMGRVGVPRDVGGRGNG